MQKSTSTYIQKGENKKSFSNILSHDVCYFQICSAQVEGSYSAVTK